MKGDQFTERWGTFSVTDHLRPQAFVADVLLYDQLLIPRPADRTEKKRWEANAWNPDKLDRLMDILGDLVKPIDWSEEIWQEYQERFREEESNGLNASLIMSDKMFLTALGIARFTQSSTPEGAVTVRRMAAYPSRSSFARDFTLRDADSGGRPDRAPNQIQHQAIEEARLNWLLGYYFLVPSAPRRSGFDLLKRAVELAKDPQFRRDRAALHEWQEVVLEKGVPDAQVILDLDRRLKSYTEYMRAKLGEAKTRWAWMLAAVGVGAGAFWFPPLVLPAALGPLAQQVLAKVRKPMSAPYRSEVAAMVYTARQRLL